MLLSTPFYCIREVWQVVRHSYHRRVVGVIHLHKGLDIPFIIAVCCDEGKRIASAVRTKAMACRFFGLPLLHYYCSSPSIHLYPSPVNISCLVR